MKSELSEMNNPTGVLRWGVQFRVRGSLLRQAASEQTVKPLAVHRTGLGAHLVLDRLPQNTCRQANRCQRKYQTFKC